jgi:isoleucyl-tRNA synthetase
MSSPSPSSLPEVFSFPGEEESILNLWTRLDAFRTSLAQSEGKPEFTFYDGPPFATGLPHYGHILAGTIKDIVTRYATQTGHHVSRRFGWDCHGLPVEFEIDKALGIKGRDDVMKMGIDKYNAACRAIVTRYCAEWETTVTRLGRWIDFKNDYRTMEPWYMESVWWVFKTIFEKGLVYQSFRVMPYSTACNTPLSNFEAGLNYKDDTIDPAVVVTFPRVDDPSTSFVAWTTTPWTLPSNLALCVHPTFDYVTLSDVKSGARYILAAGRIVQLYPKYGKKDYKEGSEFTIVATCKGSDLVGVKFVPLFDYFKASHGDSAFRVVSDEYVTDDAGTGIVHQAPAFGEDDFRVCLASGIIKKNGNRVELPCPIDANGNFTDEVPDFKGQHVKAADDQICAALKAKNRLFSKGTLVHSYPFCWRSETPLIYRAVPSWFVSVETIKKNLLANNDETRWVPANIKEGRFHNWLRDARDWNISRNRYWGTPLPIWVSEDGEEVVVIGSIAELEAKTGARVTDLHREFIDGLTIPSAQGKGLLRRVDEVFDCWFESGSMPYAQIHYPFENKESFEDRFPADFIAEGLDQTRGWFYTLMVLSTALFNKPAFKNLIVNGLVLAEDGKKMSKRLQNYPDPLKVVRMHGADALRLYLINSPVVRAEPLRFRESGVLSVVRDVLLPWYNALRFFSLNAFRLGSDSGVAFAAPDDARVLASTNAMDKWITAALTGLITFVRTEMEAYRLYTVVPRLVAFVESLTNWYIRLNRRRLRGGDGAEEARTSLAVLWSVLLDVARVMAPFTPFLTETMYQQLKSWSSPDRVMATPYLVKAGSGLLDTPGTAESVHYCSIPEPRAELADPSCVTRTERMQTVIEMGRIARERRTLSLKTPVRDVVVVCADAAVLADIEQLKNYVTEELNCMTLIMSTSDDEWATLRAEPDNNLLGKRLGKDLKAVSIAVRALTHSQVREFQSSGTVAIPMAGGAPDIILGMNEVKVMREVKADKIASGYETIVSNFFSLLEITP